MNEKQFRDLVGRMRAAQKAYFKGRSSAMLEEAKRLEAEVDEEVERGRGQAMLFDGGQEGPYG